MLKNAIVPSILVIFRILAVEVVGLEVVKIIKKFYVQTKMIVNVKMIPISKFK